MSHQVNGHGACERCKTKDRAFRQRLCASCATIVQALNANIISTADYDGWVWSDQIGANDGYFPSLDALFEHLIDENLPQPSYVFCCNRIPFVLNAEDILYAASGNHHEEIFDEIDHVDELETFIKQWNAKQSAYSVEADPKNILVINNIAFSRLTTPEVPA